MSQSEKFERRFLNVTVRADGNAEKPVIRGEAAVFNQETVIGDWFREMIKPGAFKRVLSEKPDVVATLNHNFDIILGRTTAGTLKIEETASGLSYEAEVNLEDPQAVSVYQKVKRGDVNQASFSFTVRAEEWIKPSDPKDLPLRTIVEVDELYDVGPCTFGAYPQASASARSRANEFQHGEPTKGQETEAVAIDENDPQEQVNAYRRRLSVAG